MKTFLKALWALWALFVMSAGWAAVLIITGFVAGVSYGVFMVGWHWGSL